MDEFRERLRRIVDEEQMVTTVEVTIVRQRFGRNGDAKLPVTHVREKIEHPDAQHMASLNARLEAWLDRRPKPEDVVGEVEVFAEHEVALEERASGARFFAQLDEPPADSRELELPASLLRPAVEPAEPDLVIPAFVFQPHPAPGGERRAS